MGVQPCVDLRAPFYFRTKGRTVRERRLQASVCRRFLCFVSFSPLEKEMKCRHAPWLIVIRKKIQHITRDEPSRTVSSLKPQAPRPEPQPPNHKLPPRKGVKNPQHQPLRYSQLN